MHEKFNAKNILAYLKEHWFIYFAVLFYVFFTIYYMGPALLQCNNVINGTGDSTAGSIWRNSLFQEGGPFIGHQSYTNYPKGESLASPVDTVVAGQSLLAWSMSKIAGPVCGYNLTNALGFVFTALMMFGFILWLLGNRWLALFTGYAAAFTPFYQVKTGVHIGYAYTGLLIAIIWLFCAMLYYKRLKFAVLAGVLTAFCFYFDPYFSLFAITIMAGLFIGYFITSVVRKLSAIKNNKLTSNNSKVFSTELKLIIISALVGLILILPIAFIAIFKSAEISTATAGTRENILIVANQCSNLPVEYLLPFPHSNLLDLAGPHKAEMVSSFYAFSNCGIAEDSVGLGWPLLLVIIFGFSILFWEWLQKKRVKANLGRDFSYLPLVIGLLVSGTLALMIALPPEGFFIVPDLSSALLSVTKTWRIISREYVVLNIISIIIFALVAQLIYVRNKQSKTILAMLFSLLALLLLVQYQTYRPFGGNVPSTFNYSAIPDAYTTVRNDEKIRAVAEYPIENITQSNVTSYYLTMQAYHKKPLINTSLNNEGDNSILSSIKNLKDPQTIPSLKRLGVTTLIIHGVSREQIENMKELTVLSESKHGSNRLPESPSVKEDTLIVASIKPSTVEGKSALVFNKGQLVNSEIQKSAIDWQYEIPNGTKITNVDLSGHDDDNTALGSEICFDVKMASAKDIGKVRILDADNKLVSDLGTIKDTYETVKVELPYNKQYVVRTDKGVNIRMTRLGCE